MVRLQGPESNRWRLPALCVLVSAGLLSLPNPRPTKAEDTTPEVHALSDSIVFVSRQILPDGSVYWNAPKDMPGVGPHSRFRNASPGKLLVRGATGTLRILIDGSDPTSTSLHLIDVNAPLFLMAAAPNGR